MVWRSDAERWCARISSPLRGPASVSVAAFSTKDDSVFEAYYGENSERPFALDPDVLFEIGSLTKVFTAILLTKLAHEGRIELDAPIGEILPEFAGLASWITPRALSTHTSNLPRLPFSSWDQRAWAFYFPECRINPYPRFSETDLVTWMHAYRPEGKPPAPRFRYSNLSVGYWALPWAGLWVGPMRKLSNTKFSIRWD